ncbi:MAG TPA: hypothetical protein VGI66_18060 [Streptosporangiaceae bacterium]|jgi:hypothetical protein
MSRRSRKEAAEPCPHELALSRVREKMLDYAELGPGAMVNVRQVIGLCSLTWPDGNYAAPAPPAAEAPAPPVDPRIDPLTGCLPVTAESPPAG